GAREKQGEPSTRARGGGLTAPSAVPCSGACAPAAARTLVAEGDRAQQRARPREGRVQAAEPPRDGRVAAPLGGAEPAQEGGPAPVRNVDAQLLHQRRVAALDALAPRFVRLAHHNCPDGLLTLAVAHGEEPAQRPDVRRAVGPD